MTALPVPNRAKVPPVSERTAAMIARRHELDDPGRAFVIGYLSAHSDPAVLCALAGGIAAWLAREPEPTHALWRREQGGEWEDLGHGTEPELSALAKRGRADAAAGGVTAGYLVLPLGEAPDHALGGAA